MPHPATNAIMKWAKGLRHPTLFALITALLLLDLLLPDPLPLVDEIVLGLGTLLLANRRRQRDDSPSRGSN